MRRSDEPFSGKPPIPFFSRLRNHCLAGVLVTAPIGITLYLTVSFLHFIDDQVAQLIPARYNPDTYLPFSVPGIGLALILVFLAAAGWLARNFFGRWLIRASERVVGRMPVVRSVYGVLKQVFETAVAGKSQAFREVVLFEYPRPGLWAVGFVSGAAGGEVRRRLGEETLNVFVPTTPNPTSGFLLFVPRREVIVLDMTVEEAITMVVSAGLAAPGEPSAPAAPPSEK
jgi:uncharacterized membrane protein